MELSSTQTKVMIVKVIVEGIQLVFLIPIFLQHQQTEKGAPA